MNINDLIKEAQRELRMRERVYPKWVASEKMKPQTADRQLAAQKEIVRCLTQQRDIFEETNRDNKATLYKEFVSDWKAPPPKVEQPRLFDDEEKRSHYHHEE